MKIGINGKTIEKIHIQIIFRETQKPSTSKNEKTSDTKNVSSWKRAGQVSSADAGESIIVTGHNQSPSRYDRVTYNEDVIQHTGMAGDGDLNIEIEPNIKKNLTQYDQTKDISLIFKNCTGYS